jgi:glycosyltransferase involved in cell wall biosynthesis
MMLAELQRRFLEEREYAETMGWRVARPAPLVSVVVTTYQQAEFIDGCLDGVLMQRTAFPFEVVVGEDGSTDGTRERCVDWATRHPDRIRLFLRSRAEAVYTGGGRARRLNGIWSRQAARGAFVAVCDGDDRWTDPDKLQKQVDFLGEHPECVSCFHAVDVDDRANGVTGPAPMPPPAGGGSRYGLGDLLRLGNVVFTSSEVYRNAPETAPPEWFYALPYRDFARHVLTLGTGEGRWIGYLPESMAIYRRDPRGSWLGRGRLQRISDELEVYTVLGEKLDLERRAEWRAAYARLLAERALARFTPRALAEDVAMAWRRSPRIAAAFAFGALPARAFGRVLELASGRSPARSSR